MEAFRAEAAHSSSRLKMTSRSFGRGRGRGDGRPPPLSPYDRVVRRPDADNLTANIRPGAEVVQIARWLFRFFRK